MQIDATSKDNIINSGFHIDIQLAFPVLNPSGNLFITLQQHESQAALV